jgi:pimeloyl-ACP methyl ester carboxylesterase
MRRRIFAKNFATAASFVAVVHYRDGRPGGTARPRSQDRTIFRNAGNADPFAMPYTSRPRRPGSTGEQRHGVPVTVYVLVHGACCGSWIWKRVRDRLAAAGHRVFTPTLTGLGERSHLLDRRLGVETHIDDVANLLV